MGTVRLQRTTHPARVWIEESPEDAIAYYLLHAPATVEKDGEHALPQLDYAGVLLCLGGPRSIVCHGVLLGDRRHDKDGMQIDQRRAQRGKLRVPALDLKALQTASAAFACPRRLGGTYAAANGVLDEVGAFLARVCDEDELVGVLVQPLLDACVVAAPPLCARLGGVVVLAVVDVAHVPLRDVLGRLVGSRRRLGRRRGGAVRHLASSAHWTLDGSIIEALQAVGEARPGASDELESWRANDPYGLLSSSSHMAMRGCLQVEVGVGWVGWG